MSKTTYGSLDDLSTNEELDGCTKLDTLFGKTLEIKSFDLIQVGANDCAVIKLVDGTKISSFGKVILDQLKLMTDQLNRGVVFKVRPVKVKNYYKFEEVE